MAYKGLLCKPKIKYLKKEIAEVQAKILLMFFSVNRLLQNHTSKII